MGKSRNSGIRAVLLLVLLSIPVVGGPAQAATCTGDCSCTDYAKAMRPDLSFISANAKDWGTVAAASGYLVNSNPKAGDIVVFQPGVYGAHTVYGHVAYVTGVNSNGTFNLKEKGWCYDTWTDLCAVHYRSGLAVKTGVTFIHKKTPCSVDVGEGTSRYWLFQEAYERNGGYATLGCPTGLAHWWGYESDSRRLVIQDFTGSASFGSVAIIHDELRDLPAGTVKAFVVHGGIWEKYVSLGGWESWLGMPTSDEFVNGQGYPQSNFAKGYIVWKDGGQAVKWFAGTDGWATRYYNNMDLKSGPTYVRSETDALHDWGSRSPGNGKLGVFADQFSMRQTRSMYFPAGCYKFTTHSDDGVRLFLYYMGVSSDKRTLINQWHDGGDLTYSAKIYLPAAYHTVQLEYFENGGLAYVDLTWKRATGCP
jgi:surface antigen